MNNLKQWFSREAQTVIDFAYYEAMIAGYRVFKHRLEHSTDAGEETLSED